MEHPSRSATAAEALLGQSLREWLLGFRRRRVSFTAIAAALRDATGGVIEVSDETIRRWCDHYEVADAWREPEAA